MPRPAASASIRRGFAADAPVVTCTAPRSSISTDSTGASSSTVAGVSATASAAASASISPPIPPRRVKKTGAVGSGGCARRSARSPSSSDRDRSATPATCGATANALSRSASPALIPPISGSTSRSSTSRPNRDETSGPRASGGVDRRGSNGSSAARAIPPTPRIPDRATGRISPGTPSARPAGSRRSRPRAHT